MRSCDSPQRPRTVRRAQRVCEVARAVGEDVDLTAQRSVRLLARAVELLHLRAHALQRLLERRHRRFEARAGELEELRARRLKGLGGRRPHRASEAIVERRLGCVQPRGDVRHALAQGDVLVPEAERDAAAAAKREQHGARPDGEAEQQSDDECDDRHEGVER